MVVKYMAKRFKTIKSAAIISILLVSIFMAMVPTTTTSAGPLGIVNLSSYVRVDWKANDTKTPIIPRGEMRQIDIEVTYGVTHGSIIKILADLMLNLYQGRQVNIKLDIVDVPSWCTATLKTHTITAQVSKDEITLGTVLTIRLDENAPAYGAGYVRIKASVDTIGLIEGYEKQFDLEFTPEYLPLVNAQVTGKTSINVGPLDSAVFPIEIQNLGNSRTIVFLDVDVPQGWIAVVTDQITILEGSAGTAYLTVKPPKEFGWHYDREQIKISVLPTRAENIQQQGEITHITVMVESRGFSTPGFESVVFIAALFAVVFMLKRRKK